MPVKKAGDLNKWMQKARVVKRPYESLVMLKLCCFAKAGDLQACVPNPEISTPDCNRGRYQAPSSSLGSSVSSKSCI
jgi:hypothetical protein